VSGTRSVETNRWNFPSRRGGKSKVEQKLLNSMEPSRFAGKIMALKIAYSLVITPIPMVYGTYNYSIHGVYKPTYNWGAPNCM